MSNGTGTQVEPLVVASEDKTRAEIGLIEPGAITVGDQVDPGMDKMATEFISVVMAYDPTDPAQVEARQKNIMAVENLGAKAADAAANQSAMLKEPIRALAAKGEDGGEVAKTLVDLKLQVEELDPAKFDLSPGMWTRIIGVIPGVGKPLKRYFTKFESAQTVIDAILHSLTNGKKMLERDNKTLSMDQNRMRALTIKLENTIKLGMHIDGKLEYSLERDIPADDPRQGFIKDELIFPLRQRIQGLQKQLAVNQQGVLAIEIIIRNNKELIRGVELANNTTVNALSVAVIVSMALANQKIVLDKISALNETTDNLIASTAHKLKTQGVEIQKQAAEGGIKIDTLEKAFADINQAMDDISTFRQKALPQMASNILRMDDLTKEAEESIKRVEEGNAMAPSMELELLDVDEA